MIRVGEVVHMLEKLTSAIEGGLVAPVQLQQVQELVTSAQALTQVRRLLGGFCSALDCRRVFSGLSCCHPARRVNIFGVHRIRQGSVCMPLLLVCCCMKLCVGLSGKCDESDALHSVNTHTLG
jgi:hypothetical protein